MKNIKLKNDDNMNERDRQKVGDVPKTQEDNVNVFYSD